MRWLVFAVVAGCGGGSVCGNGKIEAGEDCDDGNTASGDGCSSSCRAEATIDTFVHWTFVTTQSFEGETCDGVGGAQVALTLTGPKTVTQRVDCSFYQYKFSSLPQGTYTVRGTVYNASGAALTKGLATLTFEAAGATQNVTLDFPYEDFGQTYLGTFFFKTTWGGVARCTEATPKVMKERLRMVRDGVALGGMTLDGTPLDGSAAGPCKDGGGGTSQAVTNLEWGPAEITITGEDGAGNALYRKTFDTFVGAGLSNPTAQFDVPSLAPDAGPPDAPVADAPLAGDAG